MRISKFYATTALTMCLVSPPFMALAQSSMVTDEDLSQLSPLAQICIANPQGEDCGPIIEAISDCAADMDAAQCDVLFDDPDAVFASPEDTERAQTLLQQLDDELAALDDTDTDAAGLLDGLLEDAPEIADDLVEDIAPDDATDTADAMQRALEEEAAAAEQLAAEAEAQAELAAQAQAEAEAEARAEAQAEAQAEAEARAEVKAEAQAQADADAQAQADADAQAQADADAQAQADADALAEMEAEAARDESATAEADDTPELTQQELEAERARQLAEAEDMAQDAPELVIEDAPEEELIAPVDTPQELDSTQQAAIDQMLEDPSVSSAVGLLGTMLGAEDTPVDSDPSQQTTSAATLAAREDDTDPDTDEEAPEVTEEQITAAQTRSSRDDFESRMALNFESDAQAQTQRSSSNRRDLERAGLVALGALAVGMVINQNRVVARSDERVVVDQGDGQLQLWRDDDAILLQDGSTRRIERYSDGSTRTRWERLDGTQILTIRDATGRVLRRDRVLTDGTIILLVDDTRVVEAIDVTILPRPRTRELRITQRTDPELALALLREAEVEARALDRSFSLRQIRETRELRETLPLLSPEPITFETNRANVRSEEASKLLQVGRLMERLIANDPREIFLIEGHTDATGPAAFNLALSDRRAESVALALTEFFDIPPENLVVQGYGKRYLRIQTLQAEERNRRVAIRRITPLLGR